MDLAQIRRLTIVALFSDDTLFEQLVLKGGNAISLIYGLGGRASLDLDFSIEKDFKDAKEAEQRIFDALKRRFGMHGLILFDGKFAPKPATAKPELPWWGGYQFEFKLIEKPKYDELDCRRRTDTHCPSMSGAR